MASFAPDCFSYCAARSARANCRSEAAAMRSDCARRSPALEKNSMTNNIAEMGRSSATLLHCRIVRDNLIPGPREGTASQAAETVVSLGGRGFSPGVLHL